MYVNVQVLPVRCLGSFRSHLDNHSYVCKTRLNWAQTLRERRLKDEAVTPLREARDQREVKEKPTTNNRDHYRRSIRHYRHHYQYHQRLILRKCNKQETSYSLPFWGSVGPFPDVNDVWLYDSFVYFYRLDNADPLFALAIKPGFYLHHIQVTDHDPASGRL